MVISATLTKEQEIKLLKVLKENKRAIGWSISDLKRINPLHASYLFGRECKTSKVATKKAKSPYARCSQK